MKASLNWIRDYVNATIHPLEIAAKLTSVGLEAESIQIIGGEWDHVLIGKVLAINPHPNADRLRLATIDLGNEQMTVVCGAPNLNIGDKIVFARVGAKLNDPYKGGVFNLKTATIRGVSSSGMVCSEKELGISDKHEGIIILPPNAPIGKPLADYMGDTLYDFEVTPNRPDLLSVIGIAREIAIHTGQNIKYLDTTYLETEERVNSFISLEIKAPDLCPRYCASIIKGVKIAYSPEWMQRRLVASGMRPINNIVDVTNYVMLEYGQPLHAFDYEFIKSKKIVVRRAFEGEIITSLDGVERHLTADMLVIADGERAVAIAGVMGGIDSEVSDTTTDILLEAASFKASSIHHTGSELGISSEARNRFERGINAELAMPALRRATQLLVELGGGEACKNVEDLYPGKKDIKPILLSDKKVNRLLGCEFSLEYIEKVLVSAGCSCNRQSESEILVTSPYWRSDINLPVDLVEEVARIAGYDKIPITLLAQEIPHQKPDAANILKREVLRTLTGFGFQEIVSYSLCGKDALDRLCSGKTECVTGALRLANPMTAEQEFLRPNLRGNVLTALAVNRKHEEGGIRLFEMGKVYLPSGHDIPEQPDMVCTVISGPREEVSWHSGRETMDFFDVKGVVESLFSKLGVDIVFGNSNDNSLHPSRQAVITAGGEKLGVTGEFHPVVLKAFEIIEPVFMFEINLKELVSFTSGYRMYQPIPRFPAIVRDIALIIDTSVTNRQIQDIIRHQPLVKKVAVFDVYYGEQVPAGKKSLAYRITYQSTSHTLTDKEVDKVHRQILDRLEREFSATLRA
ncbi:phenylalanine--tRNA ligase subunit beta [Chloroflexota bacterium]